MRYLHACFFNCQKTDTFVTKEKVRFRWISYCNYITYITLFQLSSWSKYIIKIKIIIVKKNVKNKKPKTKHNHYTNLYCIELS